MSLDELRDDLDRLLLNRFEEEGLIAQRLARKIGGVKLNLADRYAGCVIPAFNASGLLAVYLQVRYDPMIPVYVTLSGIRKGEMGPGGPIVQNLRPLLPHAPQWELDPAHSYREYLADVESFGLPWLRSMCSTSALINFLSEAPGTIEVTALASLLVSTGDVDNARAILQSRSANSSAGDRTIMEKRLARVEQYMSDGGSAAR